MAVCVLTANAQNEYSVYFHISFGKKKSNISMVGMTLKNTGNHNYIKWYLYIKD